MSEWKDADSTGKWVHPPGEWFVESAKKEAHSMQASEDMKFHSISAPLDKKASTTDGTLVVQFTVKHEKKDYAFCGGGYIKLLPGKVDAKSFGGDTPYSIMFGPDLCGYDVSRIHLIFEHNGENLLKEDEIKLDYADKDEFTHLYTLVLEKDGSYEVFLDQDSKAQGNIVDGWAFPDKEIKDPEVSKPEDWDAEEDGEWFVAASFDYHRVDGVEALRAAATPRRRRVSHINTTQGAADDRQPRLQGRVEGADDRQPGLQGPLGAPADPQ